MSGLLLFILVLMNRLQQMGAEFHSRQASHEPSHLENLTYRNPRMGFLIQAPSVAWKISEMTLPDRAPAPGLVHNILSNTTAVVELVQEQQAAVVARCEVGVFNLKEQYSAQAVANASCRELLANYRTASDSVRLIAPVTAIASGVAEGAFFVAQLPAATLASPLNIWIMAYLVKNRVAYALTCQTSEQAYPRYREDFEKIIASFRLL